MYVCITVNIRIQTYTHIFINIPLCAVAAESVGSTIPSLCKMWEIACSSVGVSSLSVWILKIYSTCIYEYYAYTYVYIYTHTHTYIHIHIYIHTHTYIQGSVVLPGLFERSEYNIIYTFYEYSTVGVSSNLTTTWHDRYRTMCLYDLRKLAWPQHSH